MNTLDPLIEGYASELNTKLTTGSRMDSKRNAGRRIACHRCHRVWATRLFATGSFASKTVGLVAFTMFSGGLLSLALS